MNEAARTWQVCSDCHQSKPESEGLMVEGEYFCHTCWQQYVIADSSAEAETDASDIPAGEVNPWRHYQQLGVFQAFLKTIWAVIRYNSRFFQAIKHDDTPRKPLLFAGMLLLLIVPGMAFNLLLMLHFIQFCVDNVPEMREAFLQSFSAFFVHENELPTPQVRFPSPLQLALTIAMEFMIFDVLIGAWIQHYLLLIFGKNTQWKPKEFDVTLQIRCYSMVGRLLVLFPIFGMIAAPFATVALNVLGLLKAQKLNAVRAILVALAPIIVYMSVEMSIMFLHVLLG